MYLTKYTIEIVIEHEDKRPPILRQEFDEKLKTLVNTSLRVAPYGEKVVLITRNWTAELKNVDQSLRGVDDILKDVDETNPTEQHSEERV